MATWIAVQSWFRGVEEGGLLTCCARREKDDLPGEACRSTSSSASTAAPTDSATPFSTPPSSPLSEEGPRLGSGRGHWCVGACVERLLDDVSDIWAGATVVGIDAGGLYSVAYADDGSVEHQVDGYELRPRKSRLEFPVEVWERIGSCMDGKLELTSFEVIVRRAREAAQEEAKVWWCSAYHDRFGICGPRCKFKRLAGRMGLVLLGETSRQCSKAAAQGLTSVDRKPWKERYSEQERFDIASKNPQKNIKGTPGDSAYALCGRKVNLKNPTEGMFYDPRLGKMVREG